MRNKLKKLYLSWLKDFLTLDGFTSYLNSQYPSKKEKYYINNKKAERIINIGRKLYNRHYND